MIFNTHAIGLLSKTLNNNCVIYTGFSDLILEEITKMQEELVDVESLLKYGTNSRYRRLARHEQNCKQSMKRQRE